MPRKKRIWYPGATYHVMSRGNRRGALFRDRSDYLLFLEYLSMIKERFPFKLHAICLMTNHFHIAIETQDESLSRIMQRILHLYAREFNNKYKYTGHLFEGRFTSCLIEDERYFLEVSRYIHLNPVKAMMVKRPEDYEYGSYRVFMSDEPDNIIKDKAYMVIKDLVDTSRTFGCFCNNKMDEYRMFVEGEISHAEQEQLIQKDMKEDDMWLPLPMLTVPDPMNKV